MNGRRIIGIILLAVGIISLLGRMELIDSNFGELFSKYWPLLLVSIGLFNLFTNPTAKAGGLVLLAIGIFFQLRVLGHFALFTFDLIWPLIIILVGVGLLFAGKTKWSDSDCDIISAFALFSGIDIRNRSRNFKGGNAMAMFGGAEIDLRGARIAEGDRAELELVAAFGGIDVFAPREWNVVIKGLPLFGGISNETENTALPDNAPTLFIKGFAAFGGIDITN
jgi:hypothetical protein